MTERRHLSLEELQAGLDGILKSPKDGGMLELIVRRPGPGLRESLETGELDPEQGLAGDCWKTRKHSRPVTPETQITMMNSRVIALLAQGRDRWRLAGDQLFVDLDLSPENLPPGARLALGSAVLEITAPPHTGCSKFAEWFGPDAVTFINSPEGKKLRLRGVHAKVLKAGSVRVGDLAGKLQAGVREI